jgi:peptidoglycan/xylan/chitin deacetylase (PgdA/CDA1 family)
MKSFYTPPFFVKSLFKEYIWESKCKKVLLTFDDGPTIESTEKIILLLNDLSIKAVFFCVGNNISSNKELTELLIKSGHSVGNHTLTHKKLLWLNSVEIQKEISMTNKILNENHNYKVDYFRPPHGLPAFGLKRILQNLNLKNIMWSLLTKDYKDDIRGVKFIVQKYLRNNSIVVLHDNKKSKDIILDSIKIVVDDASKKGFEIGVPAECLN